MIGVMSDSSATASPGLIRRVWAVGPIRYLTMGGLAFLFDAGLLWLLHEALGVDLAISTATAFLLSFVVTYSLQRKFAFAAENAVAPSVFRYALLVIFNTLATTAIVWLSSVIGLPWIVGKVAAVVATMVWNYFAYRYWVFAPKRD
jgi:putative flippase GtrA